MIDFTTTIQKFDKKGEKTGWSYIVISASQANKIKPGYRVGFRVKGSLDSFEFEKTAILPMGDGSFILPINARMRKATGKKQGDKLRVRMEYDEKRPKLSKDLLACLKEDPDAMNFFKSLPGSHQLYFSKWIDAAKTAQTKTKRLVTCMTAFSKKLSYGEMMRSYRNEDF
jgi:hypothetical protein